MALPDAHQGVVMYPPAYDVRVETLATPKIEHPDDAIIKVQVAGLCGSDLHFYRGHTKFEKPFVVGHEFAGEVVALGSSFGADADNSGRPELYSTLKVGDKIVSPFTSSCGECRFCRTGFTSRCESSLLFGSPQYPGVQAQYVHVPKAGSTLFKIPPDHVTTDKEISQWQQLSDSSLLLLADILPTGVFAVMQTLQHPNILPLTTSKSFPLAGLSKNRVHDNVSTSYYTKNLAPLTDEDKRLTIAIIGLGPVGVCATVSLLDQLDSGGYKGTRIVAIDLSEDRREKVLKIVDKLGGVPGKGIFTTASVSEAGMIVAEWTRGEGCNAVLENVGHGDALTLAYDLIQPFGVITSVGVHQIDPIPITGRALYNKNVSLTFGRCPVRAIFPFALELLLKRQDIFAGVGEETSLVDRVVGMDNETVKDSYAKYEKGVYGKVIFEPWK